MDITHLHTLLTIRDCGSFLGASQALNLSHSAVSVQMKRLEQRLGRDLFIKGKRPAQLTRFGTRFCDMAAPVVADYSRLMRATGSDNTQGLIRIGFVSTTLQTLLPVVLRHLSRSFPQLKVSAVSGLSDQLARQVDRDTLDFAYVSAPTEAHANMRLIECAREPMRIIAPPDTSTQADALELLTTLPFISFSRSTWLGAQIHASLRAQGLRINQLVELDSIDAIENLVAQGFGVSVVPQRIFSQDLGTKVKSFASPLPNKHRVLSLVTRQQNDRQSIESALVRIVTDPVTALQPSRAASQTPH